MTDVTLTLPFPPSVNSLWRSAGRRVYRSKKYMDWIKVALPMAIEQSEGVRIEGPYRLHIWLHPPDKRHRDLDNLIKAPSDLLEESGIITNDRMCRGLMMEYVDSGPPCTLKICT